MCEDSAVTSDVIKRICSVRILNFSRNSRIFTNFQHSSLEFSIYACNWHAIWRSSHIKHYTSIYWSITKKTATGSSSATVRQRAFEPVRGRHTDGCGKHAESTAPACKPVARTPADDDDCRRLPCPRSPPFHSHAYTSHSARLLNPEKGFSVKLELVK